MSFEVKEIIASSIGVLSTVTNPPRLVFGYSLSFSLAWQPPSVAISNATASDPWMPRDPPGWGKSFRDVDPGFRSARPSAAGLSGVERADVLWFMRWASRSIRSHPDGDRPEVG